MKIREDGQKLLKVPQTQHERRKTLRSMKHDTRSFSLSPLYSQDTGGLLWMRFWRGPRETVGGAKGATPWVPSQGSLRSLIIFSQVIYKRKPNDPKPKNKLAYFGRTLDLDCWKKDNETAASYRVTLLPVRVYIALEKLVFRRTNKKTM